MPSRAIYKYPMFGSVGDTVLIEMPVGAQIVYADTQDHVPTMWAIVPREGPTEHRLFTVIGTGHELPEGVLHHLGTFYEGPFVWHLLEIERG